MCRHIGYLGPAVSPAVALFEAEHSLCEQAYVPSDMRGGGSVNVDGFGLGWYPPDGRPRRYRRACPIWADESFADLAADVRAGGYLAAVRSGTPGMPVTDLACAPFTADGWLFSHNGMIKGWPDSLADMAAGLPVSELLCMEAPTDSVLLWALLRARLRAGEKPLEAVGGLVTDVERAAPGSRLNFLLTDGDVLVASAWRHALAARATDEAVFIASEPTDAAPGWEPVPDGYAVLARPGSVEFTELDPT